MPIVVVKVLKDILQESCDRIIQLDKSVRFAGLANDEGVLLGVAEREGLKPLLTPEQRAQYSITAATRQYTRLRWQYHLGKIHYASSHYSKLIRATIPITDSDNTLNYVLLLSFDAKTENVHEIITVSIIPEVKKISKSLP
ncbi:MAG TPA: hypothetical protein VH500_25280 [Nitrososphaeraceae archaeon]